MATDLRVTLNILHTKQPKLSFQPGLFTLEQTGVGVFAQSVDVTTAPVTVPFTDITAANVVVLWNLDEFDDVAFGVDVSGVQHTIGMLRKGSQLPAIIPWFDGALLSLQTLGSGSGSADQAAKVQVIAYEE